MPQNWLAAAMKNLWYEVWGGGYNSLMVEASKTGCNLIIFLLYFNRSFPFLVYLKRNYYILWSLFFWERQIGCIMLRAKKVASIKGSKSLMKGKFASLMTDLHGTWEQTKETRCADYLIITLPEHLAKLSSSRGNGYHYFKKQTQRKS